MPPNSEIEKLERRWRDNPKGTVFAPYAEVLRKNGDQLLARDVLRQGLENHPDHIPGNIVLGRCCLDLGEDGPAEAAFAHVLELDGENVIALKALADITERQGRLAEADAWLTRLMAVDPSNDEARDQAARITAARESAAAALSAEASRPSQPAERTVEIPRQVLERAAQADRAEAGGGFISDAEMPRLETIGVSPPEVEVQAAAPDLPPPLRERVSDELEADLIPVLESEPAPATAPESAPVPDLEPAELDLPSVAGEVASQHVAGMEMDEVFEPPVESPPSITDRPFAIGHEERQPIDLRASGVTEFQSPDDSNALLELSAGKSEFQIPDASSDLLDLTPGKSEYQTPDASEELKFSSGSSSEYQTRSDADDLLRASEAAPPTEAAAPGVPEELVEPSSAWGGGLASDLAALAAMPTEEMASPPPIPASDLRPGGIESPPAWLFEDEPSATPPAGSTAALEPEPEPEPESVLETEPVVEAAPQVAEAAFEAEFEAEFEPEPPQVEEALAAEADAEAAPSGPSSGELRLIFPDDAPEPEPHRVRRVTEEAAAIRDEPEPPETVEPVVGEPEPVLTESMAELYADQGLTAEAIRVYRILAERSPHDPRLQERIRALESRGAGASRRMTYVAMETGGESVESFFRALAQARPGGGGEAPPAAPATGDAGGAPTRPARDPLSLSAIFGEEPAQRSPAPTETPPSAPLPGGPDAFSFDQFFGGPGGGNAHPSAPGRPSGASEEDLDQFQHWLKSLKK